MADQEQEALTNTNVSGAIARRLDEETRNKKNSKIVEELSRLELATDPAKGYKTTHHKDDIAYFALRLAESLVAVTAGWAIDHVIGRAMKEQEFLSYALRPDKSDDEITRQKNEANLHRNEIDGRSIYEVETLDPLVARSILLNLLIANPAGFPPCLTRVSIEALRALNFEEVLPIFEPAVGAVKAGIVSLIFSFELCPTLSTEQLRARRKALGRGVKL